MMHAELIISLLVNVVTVFLLGWYLITNLQWYDYRLQRVVLKHHKPQWHVLYFIIPFVAYYALGSTFTLFLIFAYIPSLYLWHRKLDKKLVLTWRVKRFLILLGLFVLLADVVCTLDKCEVMPLFMPLALAYLASFAVEKYLFLLFKREAKKRLMSISNLEIIAITGSYGKTSIKNFVAQILSANYRVYATPRSVNTLGGIIRDVNDALPEDTQIYVCEAGARQRGDIAEIAQFLEPQRVVVGKVGLAHVEYFKSLQNIIATKLEIMRSIRLKKAFIHISVTDEPHEKVEFFGNEIQNVVATLDGTTFDFVDASGTISLKTSVLGAFQTMNIAVAIKLAKEFGYSNDEIIKAVAALKPVEHRLQKIVAGGKIILDDGYNGNIDGMLEAVRLCSLHDGRKVVVTPGLVESSDELNIHFIDALNSVCDVVIVTGSLNAELFEKHLKVEKVVRLADKSKMQEALIEHTKAGDIILFANDAPNFI